MNDMTEKQINCIKWIESHVSGIGQGKRHNHFTGITKEEASDYIGKWIDPARERQKEEYEWMEMEGYAFALQHEDVGDRN